MVQLLQCPHAQDNSRDMVQVVLEASGEDAECLRMLAQILTRNSQEAEHLRQELHQILTDDQACYPDDLVPGSSDIPEED